MTEAHLVTYTGTPRVFAGVLEDEGAQISWTPPEETRGGAGEFIAIATATATFVTVANAP